MKNILNFENHSSYNIFYNDIPINDFEGNYYKPNIISICKNEKDIHFNKKEKIIPIEYIQNTGSSCIVTDYIPTGHNIKIQGKFTPISYTAAYTPWFQAYTNENADAYRIIRHNTDNNGVYFGCGSKAGASGSHTVSLNTTYVFELTRNSLTLNNVTNTLAPTNGTTNTGKLAIFSTESKGSFTRGKLYYFKVYDNNVIIMDLIPVRVGTVGYMYDKVSGKLFENSGTGNFVLGPDIQPIEYLQSTGTQYIDTEYIPNANTQLYIEFSVVSYHTNMAQATSPFGVRIGWQNKQFALFCPVNSATQSVVCYGNVGQSNTDTTINLNQKYICDVNKTIWLLKHSNGTNVISKTFTVTDASNLPNLHLWLFKYNNNNTMPGGDDILNIYKCTIKENDILIHDLIPVRVGQVGYMYDKVSGKLFGNLGTGNFILGQDI